MAISVRDIQEKVFTTQATNGYNVEQVDDFLDELSEQTGTLIRENLELNDQVRQLEAELAEANKATAEAQAQTPDYNEKDYFQNLQNAMRDSLIGAQRIADETVDEANLKAQKTLSCAQEKADLLSVNSRAQAEKLVADAKAQAEKLSVDSKAQAERLIADAKAKVEKLTNDTKSEVEMLTARADALKASAKSFKADFTHLLEQQTSLLRDSNNLF